MRHRRVGGRHREASSFEQGGSARSVGRVGLLAATLGVGVGTPIRGAMTTTAIRAGLGGLTAAAGFGILTTFGPATANADTVLMVGGADVQAFPGAENGVYMPAILGGYLCKNGSGNQCLVVPFSGAAGVLTPNNPQPMDTSIATAADRLAEQIMRTPGPKIAVGYSAGASVVEEAAERLSKDPNGPAAGELSLITVGPINDGLAKMVPPGTYLQSLGYTVRPSAQTKYPKTVVTGRYDGLATSNPNPLSHPLAALNNASGAIYSHLEYFRPDINLADPSYLASQDGNVRHLMLPDRNDPPPLTQALRGMGQPQMADAVVGQIQDETASVAKNPGSTTNDPYPLPPWLVDQLIGAAAPKFVSLLNDEKEKMVDMLLPVLVEHPEIFNGIPAITFLGKREPTPTNTTATRSSDTARATPSP